MGNTAKFMLVGVLAMVIVIAVIWDRASDDLTRTAAVGNGVGETADVPSPTLTGGAAQADGTIHLQPSPQDDPLLEELRQQYLRPAGEPAPVGEPEPAAAALSRPARARRAERSRALLGDGLPDL